MIVSAMGTRRPNRAGDVRTVQALLNRTRASGAPVLKEDGLFGPLTQAAITRYQTSECAPTITATPMRADRARSRIAGLTAALLLGASSATPSDANANVTASVRDDGSAAAGRGELKLDGAASASATAAVLAEAKRQGLSEVEVAAAQSFRVMEGGRKVATLVTGKGNMPDTTNAGCFLAVVNNGDAALIPTIGYADYEAETCGGPASVGLLSSGATVHFGAVFDASSPNAQLREPVVVTWDRSNNTLLIDDALSAKASQAGAVTIAKMRALQ